MLQLQRGGPRLWGVVAATILLVLRGLPRSARWKRPARTAPAGDEENACRTGSGGLQNPNPRSTSGDDLLPVSRSAVTVAIAAATAAAALDGLLEVMA